MHTTPHKYVPGDTVYIVLSERYRDVRKMVVNETIFTRTGVFYHLGSQGNPNAGVTGVPETDVFSAPQEAFDSLDKI